MTNSIEKKYNKKSAAVKKSGVKSREYKLKHFAERQNWKCLICETPHRPEDDKDGPKTLLKFHSIGQGVFCLSCRRAMDAFENNYWRLLKAAEYIRSSQKRPMDEKHIELLKEDKAEQLAKELMGWATDNSGITEAMKGYDPNKIVGVKTYYQNIEFRVEFVGYDEIYKRFNVE